VLGHRLVHIVLGDEHVQRSRVRDCPDSVGVGRSHERRLLDDDVLAGPKRQERELAVRHRRRSDDRNVDGVVGQPGLV
jgi:hypothetical protein